MPGLTGIIWNKIADEPLLDKMANSIKHEEWHRVDKYSDSFFGGARVSLGIFNPEPQPIFNEDKTICVFMYGKVYDYEKQANELKKSGHRFTVDNDADFCLHAYEEYGREFVNNLNGSFVLAIYDVKQKKVIIANDRYGFRPLYYATDGDKLLFASEVKAILQDRTFNKRLNDEAIADFFAFGVIMGNKTFFKGIETLPPASVLTYDDGVISLEQYWDFNYEPDYSLSEEELIERLIAAFMRAVDIRMRDNLRYGLLLSGGLDSRTVLAAISGGQRHRITAFTFGVPGCDEIKVARKVARRAGVNHRVIEYEADELLAHAREVVYLSDGMGVVSVSFIPYAFNRVREQVDVFFYGLALEGPVGGICVTPTILNIKSDEDLARTWYHKIVLFSPQAMAELFGNEYYSKIKDMPFNSLLGSMHRAKPERLVNKSDRWGLQNWVRRSTILGSVIARNKVEEGIPTFDNNFIEAALKIPPELRMDYKVYRKFLMRLAPELAAIPYNRTMVRADAPLIAWRLGRIYQYEKEMIKKEIWRLTKGKIYLPNKRSYVNLDEWLRLNEKWKGFVKGLLLDDKVCSKEYFEKRYIETLISEHEAGKADHSNHLCYLATFELFLQEFVDH
jgi:asparagine synthase (glutamine-hydrolysing)